MRWWLVRMFFAGDASNVEVKVLTGEIGQGAQVTRADAEQLDVVFAQWAPDMESAEFDSCDRVAGFVRNTASALRYMGAEVTEIRPT